MNNSVKRSLLSLALIALLSACGSSDLDFSIQFTGTLNKANQPVAGQVCVFGECGQTDSVGQFNFKAYGGFDGGDATVSATVDGTTSTATVNLPGNSEEVSLVLSVGTNNATLVVDSVQIVRTK